MIQLEFKTKKSKASHVSDAQTKQKREETKYLTLSSRSLQKLLQVSGQHHSQILLGK